MSSLQNPHPNTSPKPSTRLYTYMHVYTKSIRVEWSGMDSRPLAKGRPPSQPLPERGLGRKRGTAPHAKQGAGSMHHLRLHGPPTYASRGKLARVGNSLGKTAHIRHEFKAITQMIPNASTKQGKPQRSKDSCHLQQWPMKQGQPPRCGSTEQCALHVTGRCHIYIYIYIFIFI